MMDGQGVFYFPESGFFSGMFLKNKAHNTGVFHNFEENMIFVGNYKNGNI